MRAFGRPAFIVALFLALSANAACAAALGSFATSLGVFTALAAMFVIKGLPAHLPDSALSSGTALLVAAGAAWLWRSGRTVRLVGFSAAPRTPPKPHCDSTPSCVRLPEGVDPALFLAAMRAHFVSLQDAWDRGDAQALQGLATPSMLAEFSLERGAGSHGEVSTRTEVLSVKAEVLGYERIGRAELASIEFTGSMRESGSETPVPFRELWLLTRPLEGGSGWLLAKHQALL